MNEFTKEELRQILNVFARCPELMDVPNDHLLMANIAKMINNYCEHETRPVFTTDGCVIPVCMKCGKCTN